LAFIPSTAQLTIDQHYLLSELCEFMLDMTGSDQSNQVIVKTHYTLAPQYFMSNGSDKPPAKRRTAKNHRASAGLTTSSGMRGWRCSHAVGGVLAMFALVAILASGPRAAAAGKVIYSFAGDEDGEYTDTDLVIDSAGSLYGSSVLGGEFGGGTVFRLTQSGRSWIHTVLYSFTGGADGGEPYKGVTLDAQGNIYGTAVTGGTGFCEGGCGVAYKLTNSGGTWSQTVIHSFSGGDDGSGPGAGLTIDNQGNLYGMAPTGGAYGLGVIYRLHPDASGNWSFKVIHTFTGGTDGATGSAGRLLLHAGHLYGVATAGGANGKGVAFDLTPSQAAEWNLRTIYAFRGQPDAGFPYGGLLLDASGNLYGTTYYDGANNLGSVYQLSPTAGGRWTETVLYSFRGGGDGQNSISNLVSDAAGNLYGTTSEGGAGCSCGTIFKLAPGPNGTWTESVVHRFRGPPDAAFPYNGMVPDSAGNFYGASVHGGTDGEGAIYKFTP
jgi:uncharacterized repeat protein (TIGR03803 family)